MKIELDLTDQMARLLGSHGGYWVGDGLSSQDAVVSAAQACLERYCGFPEVVTRRHENALAIVRAQAVQAAATSTTEATRLSAQQTADRLLDFMLETR